MRLTLAALLLVACTPQPTPSTPPAPTPVADASLPTPTRTLRLGRVPHISQETTRKENAPLAAYLSKQLGTPVELAVPADYDAVISELESGAVDVAILPPLSYITAKQRVPNLAVIAQLVAEGGQQYLSYIVTAEGSPLKTVAELKGKRFAFVDKRSTTGYLLPLDVLRQNGVDERDLASVIFAGSHPEVVDLILAHKVDAGAIASTTFGHMHDLKERLSIIGKSEPVPFDAVVVHPNVPLELTARLRETFLGLSSRTEEGRAVLTGITASNGFIPTTDAAYDGVRRVEERLRDVR